MRLRLLLWPVALLGLTPASRALAQDSLPPAPIPAPDTPQRTGRIVGRILEEATGTPVSGARVGIAMGGAAVSAGIDGRYTLLNVPAGPTAITVRAIGYAPKTVSGVTVPEGGVVSQDVTLTAQGVQLVEITVSASQERGSVAQALDDQRNSSNVVNSVTAEEISRSPDSDAAQAVQRVSGVTVQDGRYVYVRGLGERYTTTSLNNSRLPSPEPERRIVPLDLFPSNLLDGITTTKTFTPDQSGDFSGGQVNLRTREFPLRRTFSLSTSIGFNSAVTGQPVAAAPTVGTEWRASAGEARELPADVENAGGLVGLNDAQVSSLIGEFRNAWSAQRGSGPANGSLSLSFGGEDPVLGHPLGYVLSFGYTATQETRLDERRAGIAGDTVTTRPINPFVGSTVTSGVTMGGMANFTLRLGTSKILLNNTWTRSGDNSATQLAGPSEEFTPLVFDITRLAYVERAVRSNQLQGQHLFGLRHMVDWSVTSAGISRLEPDRSDLIYEADVDTMTGTVTPTRWFAQGKAGVRTFSDLGESSLDLALNYRLELGERRQTAIKLGAARRTVNRDADTRSYLIRNGNSNPLSDPEREQDPEQLFAQSDRLTMLTDVAVGQYIAEDEVLGGYLMVEGSLNPRLRVIGGVRVERWALDLTTVTQFATPLNVTRRNTDVLPSLGLTYALGRNTNLRLSASRTLSRPEYREIAPVATRDIVGGYDFFGNADVQRALIQNYDARWEWYPSAGEVVSVGVFAKMFDQPIERVLVATTGATATSVENSDQARNYGVEVEVRRGLGGLARGLMPFTAFANATFMHSEIKLKATSQTAQSNESRPLTGQARYVVNAGLGYQHPRADLNATLLYNLVGPRIHEVGTILFPDAYEELRHLVDFSLRFPIARSVSGKVDAKNLLDAEYRVQQGDVTRLRYRTGRSFSAGLSWNP